MIRCASPIVVHSASRIKKYSSFVSNIIVLSNIPKRAISTSLPSYCKGVEFDSNRKFLIDITPTRTNTKKFHSTSLSRVKFSYVYPDDEEIEVDAEVGKNLLDVAHENNIELEGACGGELACATCHLIFEERIFDTLPEKDPEEDDMLDLAMELTDTSRLGCQVCVNKDFEGMKVQIPEDAM